MNFRVFSIGLALTLGCGGDDGAGTGSEATSNGSETTAAETGGAGCDNVQVAVVTDIDETLTVSDEEFLMQLQDGTYDPIARDGGVDLLQGYSDRGFVVVYLTARNENNSLMGTDEPARDATERWLMEHGYPFGDRAQLFMAPMLVFGDSAREYKAGVLADLQGQGFSLPFAYGNADTDIAAYDDAMIPKDATFIIGELAGTDGTVAIDGEAWTDHAASHLPTVEAVCDPGM